MPDTTYCFEYIWKFLFGQVSQRPSGGLNSFVKICCDILLFCIFLYFSLFFTYLKTLHNQMIFSFNAERFPSNFKELYKYEYTFSLVLTYSQPLCSNMLLLSILLVIFYRLYYNCSCYYDIYFYYYFYRLTVLKNGMHQWFTK